MAIEQYPKFQRGAAIYIEMECYDDVADPPVLIDPTAGPLLTLYDSTGVETLHEATMNKKSVGVYWYVYQSTVNDRRGVWKDQFTATASDGSVGISIPKPVLEMT